MKRLFLCGLMVSSGAEAAEIRWTARGTVSSVAGGAFSETGVGPGQGVSAILTYDSGALVNGRSFLDFGTAITGRAWYYGNVDLSIRVTIGDHIWAGELPVLPQNVNVMESVAWDGGGNPDWFAVNLDAARGGTFPSFPRTGEDAIQALKIEFRDDTSPAGLFDVQVLPDSLSQVCEMTSAGGSVVSGASTISFTLDPTSVRVIQPQVPLTLVRAEDSIRLEWPTEIGKAYRLEGSPDFRCWSFEGGAMGNGLPAVRMLTPFAEFPRRFYRVVER